MLRLECQLSITLQCTLFCSIPLISILFFSNIWMSANAPWQCISGKNFATSATSWLTSLRAKIKFLLKFPAQIPRKAPRKTFISYCSTCSKKPRECILEYQRWLGSVLLEMASALMIRILWRWSGFRCSLRGVYLCDLCCDLKSLITAGCTYFGTYLHAHSTTVSTLWWVMKQEEAFKISWICCGAAACGCRWW